MSAAEVLAQALIPVLGIYPANLKQEVAGEVAQKQLDALKAAGYAVVSTDDLARVIYQQPPFTAITDARARLESAITVCDQGPARMPPGSRTCDRNGYSS